jgi:hypothetical protein
MAEFTANPVSGLCLGGCPITYLTPRHRVHWKWRRYPTHMLPAPLQQSEEEYMDYLVRILITCYGDHPSHSAAF